MDGLTGCTPVMNWDAADLPAAWQSFRAHCQFFFKGPLKEKSEEEQCAYLMIWVGQKGRDVYATWTLSADEAESLDHLMNQYETFVKPKSNNVFARYKFMGRRQLDSETAEQFITELKTMVKDCGYDRPDEMVRDMIVCGTKNAKVKERLLSEGSDLSLDRAVDVARSYEINQQQLQSMNTREDPNIHTIGKLKKPIQKEFKGRSKKTDCTRCGNNHGNKKCPAIGKICNKCRKKDHFARVCKTREDGKKVHQLDDYDFDAIFVGSLTSNCRKKQTDVFVEDLLVNDTCIKFQLDTGSKCNVLSAKDFKKLNIKGPLEKAEVALRSFSGHKMMPEGVLKLPIKWKNRKLLTNFYVVQTKSNSILSGETSESIGLIKRVNSIEKEFSDVFVGLGCLPGTYHIKVDPSVKPVIQPARKVPISLKAKVKAELQRMEELNVIKRQIEPTPWVNSFVTATKSSGDVRICIDPKHLNEAILREHYPMKTVEEVVSEMPNAKVFSTLDATSGFWTLLLDEESSKLTTFQTPFGRYRFLRAPFGIKSIPEMYQRVMTEMIQDLEGAQVIVDDILVWGENVQEHDVRLKRVLERVKEHNLKLNLSKCQFRQDEVIYVGHKISKNGLEADPEKVRAVKEMSRPQNKKELQTFLGFITYLQKFLPNMSEVSAPLRKLLEKNVEWFWESEQEKSFSRLKEMATKTPVLAFYNPKEKLTLNVDSSSYGLGAVLLQNDRPIAYASRALNPTQQKYSQIEKETLAIVFGCEKFHHYVYGREFMVETDHKPLENIFRKLIAETPARISRFLMQLQKYDFKVIYKPGKTMYVSDLLSRMNLPETQEKEVPDIDVNQIQLNAHLPMTPQKYQQLKQAIADDKDLSCVIQYIENGWPDKKNEVPVSIREYWSFRDELTCVDGIVYKGLKVVIPQKMRKEMLTIVHQTHQGIVACKKRAREFMFWVGMMKQIQEVVERCHVCALNNQKNNHKEPMISSEIPDRPSSKVGADLFELHGQHYLLTVDYYSKWPEVEKLDNLSSSNVIAYLKKQFARYGYIDELVTDNGPQFSSQEFRNFATEYQFVHTTSSPHYSQSMGQTERYVQTVKHMIKKSTDPQKALLDYRNTPLEGIDKSPAQLHIGRRLKSSLPVRTELLKERPKDSDVSKDLRERQLKSEHYYNNRTGKTLPELYQNQKVMISHNNKLVPGRVIEKHYNPRSYIVETMGGRKLRRNRYHLKPTKAEFRPEPDHYERDQDQTVRSQSLPSRLPEPAPQPEIESAIKPPSYITRSGRAVKVPEKYKDFVRF